VGSLRWILNPSRLPIPPRGLFAFLHLHHCPNSGYRQGKDRLRESGSSKKNGIMPGMGDEPRPLEYATPDGSRHRRSVWIIVAAALALSCIVGLSFFSESPPSSGPVVNPVSQRPATMPSGRAGGQP
jgi:hypothetical protein